MELKPCPFCGWAGAKVHRRFRGYRWMGSLIAEIRVDKVSCYVSCNRCKARGGVATGQIVTCKRSLGDFDPFGEPAENVPMPDWATTEDELVQKAVEAWNRRPDDMECKKCPYKRECKELPDDLSCEDVLAIMAVEPPKEE